MTKENEVEVIEQYLKDIKPFSRLLSFEEELNLGQRIKKGLIIIDESKPVNKTNVILSPDADDAFDTLFCHNLRLVVSIAKVKRGDSTLMDRIQYGNLGLMTAVLKYDPDRKLRFTTSAYNWIKQAIQRGIADNERAIRIPVHEWDELTRVSKIQNQLSNILGREPSLAELSVNTGMSEEFLLEGPKRVKPLLELDGPAPDKNGERELGEILPATSLDYDKELDHKELKNCIENVLNLFCTEREKLVLLYEFGFIDGKKHTLEQIGEKAGISRERIRQIRENAFSKIRASTLWSSKLRNYLE